MCEREIDWLPLACPQLGTWPATQACALTRNQTGDLSVHRPTLNPPSHTRQGKKIFLVDEESMSALAGVAPWTEHKPENQKVTGLIPGQGTCLGCRPGPRLGVFENQWIDVSLAH